MNGYTYNTRSPNVANLAARPGAARGGVSTHICVVPSTPVKHIAPEATALRDELHSAGLRGTSSRIAVLGALRRAGAPLSHGQVVDALRGRGFDRATLYRNLIDLTDAGLLRRIDVGDHTWRFETGDDEPSPTHPHFVCVDCGSLACLPDVDVQISPRPGSRRTKIAGVSQVLLQGRCANC